MQKILLLLVLIFGVCLTDAFSATKTWSGSGANGNWSTAANWVGNVAPVAGDSLVFPATAAQFSTTNNLSSLVFSSMTIEGGNYSVGGSTLNLMNGLTVNGGSQTFNVLILAASSQTFNAAQNATVTLGIVFISSGFPNPFVLTLDGAGVFVIGVITGTGSLTKTGLGASLIASASNYSGAVTHNNGVLVIDGNLANSPLTINAGTTGNPDFFGLSGVGGTGTIGATTVTAGVLSAGTLTSPTGILNINNGLTFTANGNYVCKISGTTAGAGGYDQLNVTGTVTLNNARLVPLPFETAPPPIGTSLTILKNDGTDAINGTFFNAPEGAVFGGALNTAFRITYRGGDGNDIVITRVARSRFDFDGDGKSDISVFRVSNGAWYLQQSTNGFYGTVFGFGSDKIVPADYDGDNKTDIAVYRGGYWYLLRSSDNTFSATLFGISSDIPVPNDYDGDGRADIAVFRPSNGTWYELRSINNQFFGQQFGQGGDYPVIGDFDGDGLGDLAVFRIGNWYFFESSTNSFRGVSFGNGGSPVSGDFDGDGKTDLAVIRRSTNPSFINFYIQRSSDSVFTEITFGDYFDIPVIGDYDGDGKSDVAVFRPSNGTWYLNRSTAGFLGVQFGRDSDQPIPNSINTFPQPVSRNR